MLLAALAASAGAALQSATGFGFALVAALALFAVLEPAEALTTLLLLGSRTTCSSCSTTGCRAPCAAASC